LRGRQRLRRADAAEVTGRGLETPPVQVHRHEYERDDDEREQENLGEGDEPRHGDLCPLGDHFVAGGAVDDDADDLAGDGAD
jgi:hypothetical protein